MSVFGALGLVLAFVFMNNTDSSKHLSLLFASGIGVGFARCDEG